MPNKGPRYGLSRIMKVLSKIFQGATVATIEVERKETVFVLFVEREFGKIWSC